MPVFMRKKKHLINISALLAIFVRGLGIFAFSVFFANNRKKEVVLRKINGETKREIQKLFNREFIRLTLYACIISIPLAFYFINFWLEKFAYRVTMAWYFFLLAVFVCLAFVILIITWQIRKIVNINPVECLKDL